MDLAALNSAVDFSPYEGYVARGWAATTIAGGQVVYEEGEVVADGARGRYLARPRKLGARHAQVRCHAAARPLPASPTCSTCMRVAEDAGFEFMWFGDSHLIWQEVSPYLGRRRCRAHAA